MVNAQCRVHKIYPRARQFLRCWRCHWQQHALNVPLPCHTCAGLAQRQREAAKSIEKKLQFNMIFAGNPNSAPSTTQGSVDTCPRQLEDNHNNYGQQTLFTIVPLFCFKYFPWQFMRFQSHDVVQSYNSR